MATWTSTGVRSAHAVQATTESAPVSAFDGVLLTAVDAVLVTLHAPGGQTFDGSGSLLGYVYTGSAWVRAPRADLDLSPYAGLADASMPPLPVVSATGRFQLVPSGIGLSGGTTVTSDYLCTSRKSGAAL